MKRRNFFKALAKAAAIVALAPQIAFRVRPLDLTPQKVTAGYVAYWMQTTRYSACVDAEYMAAYRAVWKTGKLPQSKADVLAFWPEPEDVNLVQRSVKKFHPDRKII